MWESSTVPQLPADEGQESGFQKGLASGTYAAFGIEGARVAAAGSGLPQVSDVKPLDIASLPSLPL